MNFKNFGGLAVLICTICFYIRPLLAGDLGNPSENATNAPGNPSREGQLAALQLEMTNASQRVIQIVNRPVRAFARTPDLPVATYSPGWFHPGASKPDFENVDVRQTQELIYAKNQYVTSDLNPGVVFLGRDLEFNSMTKYFYVNRSLPKCRLTETEMLEINRLYRIIGRCEKEIQRLQEPPPGESVHSRQAESDIETGQLGFVDRIRSIPTQTRVIYGSGIIGAFLLVLVVLRSVRNRSR